MKRKKYILFLMGILHAFSSCSDSKPKQDGGIVTPPQTQATVRAVWIPDPSHTACMRTYQNVQNTVDLLDSIGINTIYLCAWARTKTIFKSETLVANSTYQNVNDGYLFAEYISAYNVPTASPTGDPVKDLIAEADKKDIAVLFWFEYGFMASVGATPLDNPLLAAHPEWMSKNSEGKQANYNNTDFYLNAYHDGLQKFMLQLVEESMTLYPNIAGIQGDDRMPAMPRNSGYDDYTVTRYKKEHNNSVPPADFNNKEWVDWRLNILNQFAGDFHDRIKAVNKTAMVCFSPNPYPWCEENLMQQWTQWLKADRVDILSVQCYRNTIESYTSTIQTTYKYIMENTKKAVFNPGIILKNGNTIMPKTLLQQQLQANKELGTLGEAFFHIDGCYDPQVREVLKSFYK